MVNLFWLQPPTIVSGRLNYSLCAVHHLDAHIVKIPLEATQLLYNAHYKWPTSDNWKDAAPLTIQGDHGYRSVHYHNPISKWVSSSLIHYRHTWAYALALCKEYSFRYGREHGCQTHILWLAEHEPAIPHPESNRDIESAGFRVVEDPPCAMPVEFKVTNDTYVDGSFDGATNLDYTFSPCIYQSYQNYYTGAKMGLRMTSWKKREVPVWAKDAFDKKKEELLLLKEAAVLTQKTKTTTKRRSRRVKKEEKDEEEEEDDEDKDDPDYETYEEKKKKKKVQSIKAKVKRVRKARVKKEDEEEEDKEHEGDHLETYKEVLEKKTKTVTKRVAVRSPGKRKEREKKTKEEKEKKEEEIKDAELEDPTKEKALSARRKKKLKAQDEEENEV